MVLGSHLNSTFPPYTPGGKSVNVAGTSALSPHKSVLRFEREKGGGCFAKYWAYMSECLSRRPKDRLENVACLLLTEPRITDLPSI